MVSVGMVVVVDVLDELVVDVVEVVVGGVLVDVVDGMVVVLDGGTSVVVVVGGTVVVVGERLHFHTRSHDLFPYSAFCGSTYRPPWGTSNVAS